MPPELTLVLLFTVATAVAIATRFVDVPYTVALVLSGLGLGALHLVSGIHLTRDLLYAVFLPGLVFEAAYHLDAAEFRRNARAILGLAVPGVVVAIGATATLLVAGTRAALFARGFGWPHALVFAALIAATDPIAVVALFKSLRAPGRLGVLIEGESLVNDGTAIVLFTIVLHAVSGGATSATSAVIDFTKVVGLGVTVGAAVGVVASMVIRRVDDPMIEITATTIAAYGSFVTAEEIGASGVIATLTAGMICGKLAATAGMRRTTRIAVETFWRYLAFAMNSLIFLLIGLEVSVARMLSAWRPILIAFAAVTLGRALVVFLVSALLRRSAERISWQWSAVLVWGGLRGALSMVLALALPLSFPERDLIVTMTFGVVLLSIVLQGTTAGALLRRLGVVAPDIRTPLDPTITALAATRAALDLLADMERDGQLSVATTRTLRCEYQTRTEELETATDKATGVASPPASRSEMETARRRLCDAERIVVRDASRRGHLDPRVRDRLEQEINVRASRST